jgi:hypothetical protein
MHKGYKSFQKKPVRVAVKYLDERSQAGDTGMNDTTFKTDDTAALHGLFEQHSVNIQAKDVLWMGQAGGGNEAGFHKPLGGSSRKECSVVVKVFPFDHTMRYEYFDFHQRPP